MDVGVPGRIVHVAPDTLQVGGQGHAARRSDFEIAAVSKVEVLKHQGVGTCAAVVVIDERVGRDGVANAAQFKAHAVPQFMVVVEVRALKRFVGLAGSRVDGVAQVCIQLRRARHVGGRCGVEVGSTRNDHHDICGVRHGDAVLVGGEGAAGVDHLEAEGILHRLGSP